MKYQDFYDRNKAFSEFKDMRNKLNNAIIKKYEIIVPREIQNIVQYEIGKPKVLDKNKLYQFIDSVGKINIRKMIFNKDIDIKNGFDIEI